RGLMKATAAAMGVILLMAGLAIYAFFQARVAEQHLAESEAISKFLTEVFQSPDPARNGRTITVAETLSNATMKLDTELTNQPARRAILQQAIGRTYLGLGLYREAIPLFERVRDYHLSVSGPENPDTIRA